MFLYRYGQWLVKHDKVYSCSCICTGCTHKCYSSSIMVSALTWPTTSIPFQVFQLQIYVSAPLLSMTSKTPKVYSCSCICTDNSCIKFYEHSCWSDSWMLRAWMDQKPCSNNKTHIQIMKFTCCLNMDFELLIHKMGLALFTLRWAT